MATLVVEEEKSGLRNPKKGLLWISMLSMVMLFAGLTSAVIVAGNKSWFSFEFPPSLWFSTGFILFSSITMSWAVASAKKGDLTKVKSGVGLTLILGIAFVISQFLAWSFLVESNVFFSDPGADASGSYFYALTGMHLAHLVGGLVSLIVVFLNSLKEKYNPKNMLGLELCATFWHFLDVLWVYLFLFLLFIR